MGVKIKATVEFSVSDTALEDALAEYDELTVEGLLREILDKDDRVRRDPDQGRVRPQHPRRVRRDRQLGA